MPPAKFVLEDGGRTGQAFNSLVSTGCIISGATVRNSVLSPGVVVDSHALVEDSVLMHDVVVGAGAIVRRTILDKHVVVPPGARIGCDRDADSRRFTLSPNGITVLGKGQTVTDP
jgi:glucose-1-phosphate adenylyltransferase